MGILRLIGHGWFNGSTEYSQSETSRIGSRGKAL